MKFKLFLSLSILISVSLMIIIVQLIQADFDLNKQENYTAKIEVWLITPSLASSLTDFQEETNIKVTTKVFSDFPSLLKELDSAKISGDMPDIVETNANEINEQLVQKLNFKPIHIKTINFEREYHTAIRNRFTFNGELYAFPIGMEMPVIIYNRTQLKRFTNELYPFNQNIALDEYEQVQSTIKEKQKNDSFWLFHFDEEIDWYWHQALLNHNGSLHFEKDWTDLIHTYQLMPPLDHGMSITRFSNGEIGALITSSKNIQTIQKLIGNRFEMEVQPFSQNESDSILISGNGLMILNDKAEGDLLFKHLQQEEQTYQLLVEETWLPVKIKNFQQTVKQLPMGKYFQQITLNEEQFTGKTPYNAEEISTHSISQRAIDIEKSGDE